MHMPQQGLSEQQQKSSIPDYTHILHILGDGDIISPFYTRSKGRARLDGHGRGRLDLLLT
jgi:hypothetical protein